jgi:hypothetical protein
MYLADFRMQFYAHTSFWERLDAVDSGRTGWLYPILSSFVRRSGVTLFFSSDLFFFSRCSCTRSLFSVTCMTKGAQMFHSL